MARLKEFKKVGKLVTFERILSAPHKLQLLLEVPKRTHVHCSYRQTRNHGHWDHTS